MHGRPRARGCDRGDRRDPHDRPGERDGPRRPRARRRGDGRAPMIVVAVPVKDLVNAKQRLIGALSPAERMALARAMLHDVLRALVAAPVDARWVVTRGDAGGAEAGAAE